MKTYSKTLTKMEQAFLKQGLEQNKKTFASFYLHSKPINLNWAKTLPIRRVDQLPPALGASYIPWASGLIENCKHLQNNKYHIFVIATNFVKSCTPPHIRKRETLHCGHNLNIYKYPHKHRYHADCQTHLQASS